MRISRKGRKYTILTQSTFLLTLEVVVCTVIVDDGVVPYYLEDCWKWAVGKEEMHWLIRLQRFR